MLKAISFILVSLVCSSLVNGQLTVSSTCCGDSQIQVSGEGTVSGQPNIAIVIIRFNERGATPAEAVKSLSAKVTTAINTLKANGYDGSYETGSLTVNPQYNFVDGKSIIVAQGATQSLTVRVRGLDAKGQKVGTLVDALAKINGLNIDSVTFDIEDKTDLQTKARAAAYQDAKAKAGDYATFAGLSLGRTLTIDDSTTVESAPIALRANALSFSDAVAGSSTSVPVGALDVTYRTTITFALN